MLADRSMNPSRASPRRRPPCRIWRVLALFLGFAAFASTAVPAGARVINRIVATVDGKPITAYELELFATQSIRSRQGGLSADRDKLLDILITDKLIEQEAAEKGIIVRQEDIDRYVEDIKERNKLTDAQLDAALAAQGVSKEEYRKQIRQEIERQQLIAREIRGRVNVTPEEVRRYYEAHISDYATPERYNVAHIVIRVPEDSSIAQRQSAEELAARIYDQIRRGADFAVMAGQYSQDSTAASGGDLGWFEPRQLVDSLEEAVLKLRVGEVSPPVASPAGWHILKLLGREEASHRGLADLEGEIKEKLYAEALERRFERWLNEELRQRHDVDIRP